MAQAKEITNPDKSPFRQYLVVPACERSKCMICCKMIPTASIISLANCTHSFCHTCLKAKILQDATGSAPCPYPYGRFKCKGILEDKEIEGILGKKKEDRDFSQRQIAATTLKLKDLIQLVTLTEASIVPNPEPFECSIC